MHFQFKFSKNSILGIATAAALLAAPTVVAAGDTEVTQPEVAYKNPIAGASGVLRLSAQYVDNTATRDDGFSCSNGGSEFCSSALGATVYGGYHRGLSENWSMVADLTLDYHEEPTAGSSQDDDARYYALGFHLIREDAARPWGIFAVVGGGTATADSDDAPHFFGAGYETDFGNFWLQAGGLFTTADGSDDDGFDNLFFVRAGRNIELSNGFLRLSGAVGGGDFEEDSPGSDNGRWLQVSAMYHSPIRDNMEWFAGYQGDYVNVDGSPSEQTFAHTIQAGINITFGRGTGATAQLPFETPNFRAPVSYAGELN